jgi:hypothetical protein
MHILPIRLKTWVYAMKAYDVDEYLEILYTLNMYMEKEVYPATSRHPR